jgi:uncharacterized RDD family membrane protein YckC
VRDRDLALLLLLLAATAVGEGDDEHPNGILSRVAARATGAVVDIVDPDAVLEKVDVNALVQRVDVDALVQRVDVNALMDRVDVNELLDRVDVNRLMDRVDVEAIVDRVDVEDIVDRAGIADIVKESTGALAGSAIDVGRRQLVALDSIVGSTLYRLVGRDPTERPTAPTALSTGPEIDETGRGQVTGNYAGPVSRLLAFIADAFFIWAAFTLTVVGIAFVAELFTSVESTGSFRQTLFGLLLFAAWAFVYFWASLALAGRTFGMGIVGISVVARDGEPLTARAATRRTLVFPFSFVLFLGFLGILFNPERRALHDAAGGTVVVYDWGDRPAEMPAPITSWVDRHSTDE